MTTPPVTGRELKTDRLSRASAGGGEHRSEFRRAWRRFKRYRPGLFGMAFVVCLVIIALLPGVFAPHSPTQGDTGMRGHGPSLSNPLGFDHIGRDQLSRLIYGSRIALTVGLLATAISVVIGVTVGAAAGYFGGWVDTVLSRLVDTVMAFPLFALLVVLAAVLGPSLITVVIVIGATVWAQYARVVRADVLSLRERDFILAARAVGATSGRIIARHMLPNILGPVIVIASLYVGVIIILESALSFIGLGVQPPTPSWGVMLNDARPFIRQFPHMAIPPGVMITLTVLAFNLMGDGLRDALDPHQEE
jgi:peptide/nickel transport system permease protein